MPSTNIYNFPYEDIKDQPGHTLHGGQFGTDPILAQAVEDELSRVEGETDADIDQVAADLTTLDNRFTATGLQTIATINSGSATNTTEFFNIPQTFRDLIILWRGQSNGAGQIDALSVRFNSDGGSNYTWVRNRNSSAENFDSSISSSTSAHSGLVGTDGSSGSIHIMDYTSGEPKLTLGSAIARGQGGGTNTFGFFGGGQWSSTAPINSVRLWPSGQLWEGDPSITLIGVPHGL